MGKQEKNDTASVYQEIINEIGPEKYYQGYSTSDSEDDEDQKEIEL
jgi:hypothetical protein